MTETTTHESVLSEYDFIVMIDTSGSMTEPVKTGSDVTRWQAVQESAMTIIRDVEKLDSDGIGLVLFGAKVEAFEEVNAATARNVFETTTPRGSTPLAEGLRAALDLAGRSDKKDLVVVFTDGVPNDQAAAAEVIKAAADQQETDDALTILFVQVGDDAQATRYLRSLDDGLKGARWDIVDAKTVAEADQFTSTVDLIKAAIAD